MMLRLSCVALAPGALAWTTRAAAQQWTGPRTADNQPDLQGFWEAGPGADNAGHSLEGGCCDAEHNRMQNRAAANIGLRQQIIVEPKNGRIPFQRLAAEKRLQHLLAVKAGKLRPHSHNEQ